MNAKNCYRSQVFFISFILFLMWNIFFSFVLLECSMFAYFSFHSLLLFFPLNFYFFRCRHFDGMRTARDIISDPESNGKNVSKKKHNKHKSISLASSIDMDWIQWLNATNEKKWLFVNRSKLFVLCFIMFALIAFSFYIFLFFLFLDCIVSVFDLFMES